jgi:tetratricopeptide (TPR) repeat protein
LLLQVGCATFGRRGAAERTASSRDLTRQSIAAMEAGQWQRAEELGKQAIAACPDDSDAHGYLAESLWHRGAIREARSHMADAVRLNPSDAALAVRAGEMDLAAGAPADGLRSAEQAIGLDPKLATAWALRGRAFAQLNQPDRAIADLQRAVELPPQSAEMLLDLAVLYQQRGEFASALAALHNLLDSFPAGQEPQIALMLEGQTLMALRRPHQAADSLRAASRRGPPSAEICYLLAQAESNAGHYAAAAAAAQQALAIDRSHTASRQLLAQLATSTSSAEPGRR